MFFREKIIYLFFVLVVVGLAIRLLNLQNWFWGDEWIFVESTGLLYKPHISLYEQHPPLGEFFYTILGRLFGISAFSMRLVPLLFTIFIFATTFVLAKDMFGTHVAFLTIALLSISKLSIEATGRIDLDGAILSSFMLLFLYFIWKFLKTNKEKYLILSDIFLFLSILTKLTGFVPLLGVLIFLFLRKMSYKKILGHGLVTIAISLLFVYMVSGISVFEHYLEYSKSSIYVYLLDKVRYLVLVTWNLTPPLSILLILFLFESMRHKKSEKEFFLIYVSLTILCFYFFAFGGDRSRYISVILPMLLIVFSNWFINNRKLFNSRNIIIAFSIGFISLIPLVLFKIHDEIWYFSLPLTIVPYIFPFVALVFLKGKRVLLPTLIVMIIFYNLFFVYNLNSATSIQSYATKEVVNYVSNTFRNDSVAANSESVCLNLYLYYDQRNCTTVDFKLDDLKINTSTVALVNYYRGFEILENKELPVGETAENILNNDFELTYVLKIHNRNFGWVYRRKQ